MADIIDQANEVADIHRDAALSQRLPEGPRANGFCLNCREPLPDNPERRWCDDDCREDWDKRQR